MPAYVGNRHPQFSVVVELTHGNDEKVIVEQRSHKNLAVRGLLSWLTQLKNSRRL
jgi:hypothetical protein